MASLYVKQGVIYLQYAERNPSGRMVRTQKSLGLKDTKLNWRKAEIIRKEKEYELQAPRPVLSHYYPLRSAFQDYLRHKHIAEKTRSLYELSFEKFIEVNGELFCSEVDETHIEKYRLENEHLSPNSLATFFRYMRAFFNWLKHKRYVRDNYFYSLKTTPREIHFISESDLRLILSECKLPHQKFFLEFLYLTGFRLGEAIDLHWRDIDFDQKLIYINNTKAKRVDKFPLYFELESLLKRNRGTSKVFPWKNASSLGFWKSIKKNLKIPFTLHDFRKSFATRLVAEGVNIYDAKSLLRHESVTTTEKYYVKPDLDRLGREAERVFGKKELRVVKNEL